MDRTATTNNMHILVFLGLFFINIGMKGAFRLFEDDPSIMWLTFLLSLMGVSILMLTHKRGRDNRDFGIIFLYAIFVLYSFMSVKIGYGLQKAFLGLLLPYVLYKILLGYNWDEKQLVKYFLYAVHILAVIAIAYKLMTGFFNRALLYGVLGPITFGWLCGMAYLLYLMKDKKTILDFVMILYFFLMVLWTGSKGPLVSSLLISFFFYRKIIGDKKSTKIIVGAIVVIGILVISQFKDDIRAVSTLIYFLEDPEGYSGGATGGSFGARLDYAKASIDIIANNRLTGVGFGNWEVATNGLHRYPHNIFFELVSETGLLIFLFFATIILSFKTKGVFKILSIYGLITLLFSGDFSYFRYTFFPLLLAHYVYSTQNAYLD